MVAKQSTAVRVYNALRNEIISRRLISGTQLIEEKIAERFHVSRTPVRDALKMLESDNLVERYPYRGCVVKSISSNDIYEIYTIRTVLECCCMHHVIEDKLITREQIAKLTEDNCQAMIALNEGDMEKASALNETLHSLIIELDGNKRIRTLLYDLGAEHTYYSVLTIHEPGRLKNAIDEHRVILKAMAEYNANLAEELLRSHLRHSRLEAIESAESGVTASNNELI